MRRASGLGPRASATRPHRLHVLVHVHVLVLVLAACGGAQPTQRSASGDPVIVLHTNVADAQVWIDGHLLGLLPYVKKGIALDPGHHRIELRRDDYFSRYADLDLQRGQHTVLELPMSPQLP